MFFFEVPKLRDALQTSWGQRFSDEDRLHHKKKGAVKLCSSIARIPKVSCCSSLLFKDTQENMIAPELLGHVAIPYTWEEF